MGLFHLGRIADQHRKAGLVVFGEVHLRLPFRRSLPQKGRLVNGDHAAGNAQGPRRCGNGLADDTASEAGNALYPVFAEMGNRGSRYLR